MSLIYTRPDSSNILILGAREYLIYPITFDDPNWTEIRIGLTTYIASSRNLLGIPFKEQLQNYDSTLVSGSFVLTDSTKNVFYFGLKETGRNFSAQTPFIAGNNFIGYATRSQFQTTPLSICGPTVNNDSGLCSDGNIAPPNSDAYRAISADYNYYTTNLDVSCSPVGPPTSLYGFDMVTTYDDDSSGGVQSNVSSITYTGGNNTAGFLGMASGVPNDPFTYCHNGMTIRVTNRGQVGQTIDIGFFNDPAYQTSVIDSLRSFLSYPVYYGYSSFFYTTGFAFDGGPLPIPDCLFVSWPFFDNSLAIADIVVEKYA